MSDKGMNKKIKLRITNESNSRQNCQIACRRNASIIYSEEILLDSGQTTVLTGLPLQNFELGIKTDKGISNGNYYDNNSDVSDINVIISENKIYIEDNFNSFQNINEGDSAGHTQPNQSVNNQSGHTQPNQSVNNQSGQHHSHQTGEQEFVTPFWRNMVLICSVGSILSLIIPIVLILLDIPPESEGIIMGIMGLFSFLILGGGVAAVVDWWKLKSGNEEWPLAIGYALGMFLGFTMVLGIIYYFHRPSEVSELPPGAESTDAGRRRLIGYGAGVGIFAFLGAGPILLSGGADDDDPDELVSDFSHTERSIGGETIEGMFDTNIPDDAELESVTFECEGGTATTEFEMGAQVPEAVGGDEEMEFVVTYDISKPEDDSGAIIFLEYVIDVSGGEISDDLIHADSPTVTHQGSSIEIEFELGEEIEGAVGSYFDDADEVPNTIDAQAVTHYRGTDGESYIQWVPEDMDTRSDESEWLTLSI